MRIEQITTTKIYADEGKVLRKKSSGVIYGTECSLGYNYYDAGVGLSQPYLSLPSDFEEIDMPEDYENNPPIIDHVKRLKRAKELIERNTKEMNSLGLSAVDALEVKEWYPKWGDEGLREGDEVERGTKFQYEDKLYAVRQTHTILAHYYPSIHTAALYVEVTPEYNDEGELGTIDNPIPYEGNMALEADKYYSQGGVTYKCFRDTVNPVYHNLADLVGLYVELA
jgi:hypothetical protein